MIKWIIRLAAVFMAKSAAGSILATKRNFAETTPTPTATTRRRRRRRSVDASISSPTRVPFRLVSPRFVYQTKTDHTNVHKQTLLARSSTFRATTKWSLFILHSSLFTLMTLQYQARVSRMALILILILILTFTLIDSSRADHHLN